VVYRVEKSKVLKEKKCVFLFLYDLIIKIVNHGRSGRNDFLSVVGEQFFNDYLRIDTKRFPISVK
jgi:hypothetical protein